MKQIKGEPWAPGETLAGNRDGIQMEDHGRGMQGVWGLFFCLSLSHCLKFPKRAASVGHPVSVTEASGEQACPPLFVSHPVSLSGSTVPCRQTQPILPHGFYLSFSHWGLILTPSDVVLSTSWAFTLGYIGGVYGGSELPLISYRGILKQET